MPPLEKIKQYRLYGFIRPFIIRTVNELIAQGLLTGEDTPAVATPLPHAETHETNGSDEVLVDRVRTLCVNRSGADIDKHKVVYIDGSGFDDEFGLSRPAIELADPASVATLPPFGITMEDIADDGEGLVISLGRLEEIDTATPSWSDGDNLYLDTTAGEMTNVQPVSGNIYRMGTVLAQGDSGVEDQESGELIVTVENLTDIIGGGGGGGFNHARTMIRAMGRC